jgi:hypothetical protein
MRQRREALTVTLSSARVNRTAHNDERTRRSTPVVGVACYESTDKRMVSVHCAVRLATHRTSAHSHVVMERVPGHTPGSEQDEM